MFTLGGAQRRFSKYHEGVRKGHGGAVVTRAWKCYILNSGSCQPPKPTLKSSTEVRHKTEVDRGPVDLELINYTKLVVM